MMKMKTIEKKLNELKAARKKKNENIERLLLFLIIILIIIILVQNLIWLVFSKSAEKVVDHFLLFAKYNHLHAQKEFYTWSTVLIGVSSRGNTLHLTFRPRFISRKKVVGIELSFSLYEKKATYKRITYKKLKEGCIKAEPFIEKDFHLQGDLLRKVELLSREIQRPDIEVHRDMDLYDHVERVINRIILFFLWEIGKPINYSSLWDWATSCCGGGYTPLTGLPCCGASTVFEFDLEKGSFTVYAVGGVYMKKGEKRILQTRNIMTHNIPIPSWLKAKIEFLKELQEEKRNLFLRYRGVLPLEVVFK